MPLVLDPERLPRSVLDEVHRSMREGLAEMLEDVRNPRGAVLDPASLRTAEEVLLAAAELLGRPGERSVRASADEANLGYAVVLAAIDLLKSHTDVPKVPPPRKVPPSSA